MGLVKLRGAAVMPVDLQAFWKRLEQRGWAEKRPLYEPALSALSLRANVLPPRISVVVISWQPSRTVVESLRFLQHQRREGFELIFVDNGSGNAHAQSVAELADVAIALDHNTGAYFARNVGAVMATAPVILFLEDDGIPAPDLLAAHLEMFERYDVISVRGRYVPKTGNPLNELATHYELGPTPFPLVSNLEGNTSYDARAFFAVGGWDDDITFGHGGMELGLRLFTAIPDARKQIYAPRPVILHDYVGDQAHLDKKRQRQYESYQRLAGKLPGWEAWVQQCCDNAAKAQPLIKKPRRGPLSTGKRVAHFLLNA